MNIVETEYKVLMFNMQYVDTALLTKGIYTTNTPVLHPLDMDLEGMEKWINELREIVGQDYINGYVANLYECELVKVTLNINKK